MKKSLLQGLLLLSGFLVLLFLSFQVDWMNVFGVNAKRDKTQEKLGALIWESMEQSGDVIADPQILAAVDSILTRICDRNGIERSELKLHLLQKDRVNAMALPDGHLVVYSGLINETSSPEELAGIIAHEVAHIEENHVMKKLVKEIGLSVLVGAAGGSAGGEVAKTAANTLSSSAFSRDYEKEADIRAVDYMIKAKIDPRPLADFMYKLSLDDPDFLDNLAWISSHPMSEDRALYLLEYIGSKPADFEGVIDDEAWQALKTFAARKTEP